MIIPPSFFLILAILPTITGQTLYSRTKTIDWLNCGEYTGCFCDNGLSKLIKERIKIVSEDTVTSPLPAEIGKCDVGIQTRFFNDDIALLKMQIIGDKDGTKLVNPTLLLYQGTNKMFGCKYDTKTEEVVLVGDTTQIINKYSISLFEDISTVKETTEKRIYLCAIKIAQYKRMVTMMEITDTYKNFDPIMKLIMNDDEASPLKQYSQDRLELYYKSSLVLSHPGAKCDTYAFKDLSEGISDTYHVQPVIKRDKDDLRCKDTHTMRYALTDDVDEIKDLKCVRKDEFDAEHVHNLVIGLDPLRPLASGALEITLIDEQPYSYTFYCAAPFGEVCSEPTMDCVQGTLHCPDYTPGKKGKKATLTCPGKKWRVKDEYHVVAEDAACVHYQKRAQNQAAFILTLPTGDEVEAGADTRCFTEYDCEKKSPISIPSKAALNDGVVSCKDANIDLKIHDYASNTTLTAKTFACDKTSGEWRNTTAGGAMAEPIRSGSMITCPANEESYKNTAEAKLSDQLVYGIIIGAGFLIFFVAMVIAFAVRYCLMHRKHKSIDAQAFLKKSKAERLEHCRKFFPEVLKSSTTSAVHINNGLMEMDMLLNLEIEDPEIWDLVYPFLMRVHGAIRKCDDQITHMLTRYLYLQAKKIIDKHGWISPTNIRKSSPEGTIRAVAVHLLTFALSDSLNKRDAEKLLMNGARKLGFRLDEQYPHCGVLLSTLSYTRFASKGKKRAAKRRRLRTEEYLGILEKIATQSTISIPEEEVIPSFGSVAQQAAFACGGVQMYGFHCDHAAVLTLDKLVEGGKIAVSYVAGLASSLYRSPAQPLIITFKLADHSNPGVMKTLCGVAPEADWNKAIDEAICIAMYYGRHLDAKRIEQRFKPKVTQPTAYLTNLKLDQNEFELAMEHQLEELREWFASHTDVEEFKAKSAYTTTDKFKQGATKEVVDAAAGDGCNSDKSASEARSVQAAPQSDVAGADAKSAVESASATPAAPEVKSAAPEVKSSVSSGSNDSKEKDPAAAAKPEAAAPPAAADAKAAPPPSEPPASNPA